jgi:hypothetical protein
MVYYWNITLLKFRGKNNRKFDFNYGRNNGRRAFPSVSGGCILLLEMFGILLLIQQNYVNKDQIQNVVNQLV